MTDEQRLEFAHRIVGCMMPGCNDLALQAIREIETAEREACAKIADGQRHPASGGPGERAAYNRACDDIAAAIRARGAEGKENG